MTDPRTGGDPAPDIDVEQYESDEGLDLQRLHAETRREPYRFRWADKWWELPHTQDLPDTIFDAFEDLTQIAEAGDEQELSAADVDTIRQVLHSAFGKRQWQQIQDAEPIPLSAQFLLFNRWMKWSGENLGESSSSTGSSESTAGRSKRTSRGSTTGSTSAKRSTAIRKSASRRASSSR